MGFVKGVSGNPGGRPKSNLSKLLAIKGAEKCKLKGKKRFTNEEAIADKVVDMALKGDRGSIEFYAERTEGKVKTTVKFEGEGSLFPGASDKEIADRLRSSGSQRPKGVAKRGRTKDRR